MTATSKAAPTPTPWALGGDTERGMWIEGPDRNANVLTDIVGREYKGGAETGITDEDVANAQLFFTAPDLLAACEALLTRYDAPGGPAITKEVKAMRAAVAKARGRVDRR